MSYKRKWKDVLMNNNHNSREKYNSNHKEGSLWFSKEYRTVFFYFPKFQVPVEISATEVSLSDQKLDM